jgi:hypothetical protein
MDIEIIPYQKAIFSSGLALYLFTKNRQVVMEGGFQQTNIILCQSSQD